jgi:hypothetical protein
MRESKLHFEQIAVEAVKKIATELPASSALENDGLSFETQDGVTSSQTDWRQLAQRVRQEQDPVVFNKLVAQLQDLLERKQRKAKTNSN